MKTKEEIIREKIYGAKFLDIVTSIEEAMEEYAQQFKEEPKQPKQPELPKRWEDLEYIKGYYVSLTSGVLFWDKEDEELEDADKNIFATKEQAEAAIALAQLSQLMEVYRQGWKPDWHDDQKKYGIGFYCGHIDVAEIVWTNIFLSFQSPEIRDEFLENFRDLIEKAKPLMS
jgi:hypothetical protein